MALPPRPAWRNKGEGRAPLCAPGRGGRIWLAQAFLARVSTRLEVNMVSHAVSGVCRNAASTFVGMAMAALGCAAPIGAQELSSPSVISGPLQIPAGRAKPGFEIARLNTENYGAFEPYYVRDAEALAAGLSQGRVALDTRLLVTETALGRLALLTDQMAYHHLAQGREGGKDWMATF